MQRLRLAAFTLLLLPLLLGAAPASDPASQRAAIEEVSQQFSAAFMRGDAAAMASLYTADAVIFPPNQDMITGREAIQRYWTLPPNQRITHHRSTATEIRLNGDHAYDYGVYEVRGERDGQPYGPVLGKYVIVWRREPEGWRMHLDMWNPRPHPRP